MPASRATYSTSWGINEFIYWSVFVILTHMEPGGVGKYSLLITGGGGLIGTHLRRHFELLGHHVETLDLKAQDLDGISVDHVGDVTTINSMGLEQKGYDGIIHLAAISRVIDAELNKTQCTRVNIGGTREVLSFSQKAGVKWFIFGSSREVYGEPSSLPVKESDGVAPMNHYGVAKVEGERMVTEFCRQQGIASCNLRFSNVYGHPGDHETRLINAFVSRALQSKPLEIHGGGQVFDFTHVNDTAEAILKAACLLHEQCTSLPDMHILPGAPVAIEDLAALVLASTDSTSSVIFTAGRDYDVEHFYGDPRRMREVLNHECSISLESGLRQSIDLFRKKLETIKG
jgi:nucleoside-diphosphate-sugar epimerase